MRKQFVRSIGDNRFNAFCASWWILCVRACTATNTQMCAQFRLCMMQHSRMNTVSQAIQRQADWALREYHILNVIPDACSWNFSNARAVMIRDLNGGERFCQPFMTHMRCLHTDRTSSAVISTASVLAMRIGPYMRASLETVPARYTPPGHSSYLVIVTLEPIFLMRRLQ